ncbi:hypothetical protein [Pyrococcus abyssi]|uniref:Uncharacterized protein n=1 Tax=Pyrococcus abyssi (strain GE5 / Orsay) TaxID=272844 RepID=G8ZI96_PYRAB|nr:hypothetical protein [Pyrococcus abyssi]CCE70337.1 TPA: hypothetical protein PAB0622.1n [Pyrococcus abyssi GE5]
MLKLYQIVPMDALKVLAKHKFRLVGPWRDYYLLKGNVFLIRELPLKITFRGKDRDVIEELRAYASRVIEGKNKVSLKLKDGRHWIVLEFED